MKPPRMFTSLGALVIVSGALAAAPTRARANDFAMPFGAQVSAPSMSELFVSATAAHWATTISAHALVTALANREDHHDLGGSIAWHPSAWTSHEGEGGWRHHDDDGEDDDDHGGKTPVPEPSTGLLLFSGVSALAGWRLRHRVQRGTSADLA